MPTILSHPAVAAGLRPWLPWLSGGTVAAGIVLTILPDIDVVGFAAGVRYGSPLGHRGFTHSLLFAALAALTANAIVRGDRRSLLYLFLCAASHGLLDALTNGGMGVALLSPFSNRRYFFPWTPIRVSPIGGRFFSPRSLSVLASELRWVWMPMIALALTGRLVRLGFPLPGAKHATSDRASSGRG